MSEYATKTGLMLSFLGKGLSGFILSWLMGLLTLVVVAGIAVGLFSGDWAPGMTFPEWYLNVGAVPIETADGRLLFSGVDSKCFACEAFSHLFDLMNVAGLKMYEFIHETVWILVVVAFALWLLRYVFDKILIDGEPDIKKAAEDIFKKILAIGIIGAGIGLMSVERLRNTAGLIINNTAVPMLGIGVDLGRGVLDTDICGYLEMPANTNAPEELKGVLPNNLKKDFLCLVNTINIVFVSGISAGAKMMALAARDIIRWDLFAILDVIGGLILAAVFLMMLIRIPFALVDIIFTLGILIAFIPIFIAGYAYDATKGLADKGIKSLIGIMFRLAMTCVFIAIVYAMFLYIGDAFYPGPPDGFSFLFPDFVFSIGSAGADKMEAWSKCYEAGGGAKIFCECLELKGMQCTLPSRGGTGVILPVLAMGMFAFMIFSKEKEYSNIFEGYMFQIGGAMLMLATSALDYVTKGVKRVGGVFGRSIPDSISDKQTEKLAKKAKELAELASRRRGDSA